MNAKEFVPPEFDVSLELREVVAGKFMFDVADTLFDKGLVVSVAFLEKLVSVHRDIAKGVFVE